MTKHGRRESFTWASTLNGDGYLFLECFDEAGVEFTLHRDNGLDKLEVEFVLRDGAGKVESKRTGVDRLIELLSEAKKRMLHRYSKNWDPRESAFYGFPGSPEGES